MALVAAHAAEGDTLRLDRGLFPAGGGSASSARFSVTGSLGQPVASVGVSEAAPLAARSGFWSQLLRWVNAPPLPSDDSLERRAGQGAHVLAAQLLVNDGDADWDTLSFSTVDATSASGGSVYLDGPWIVYVPPVGGGPATDSFKYHVADGHGGISTGTVFVQVAAPPVVGAAPLAIRSVVGPPASVEVRFQGVPGRSYQVQTANDVAGPWNAAGTIEASTSGVILFNEPTQPDPRFFRIIEP